MAAAVSLLIGSIRSGRGARVATANLDFLVRARRDETLRTDLQSSSLVVADGWPVALLGRAAGGRRVRRVAGADLVGRLCARARDAGGLRVAIYGSAPEIVGPAVARLEGEYPGVEVVAAVCPPFRALSADEERELVDEITSARPDVVFVALGCPRQERFIASYWRVAPGAVWVGVGGTFDFLAGKRKRAPGVLQRLGVEWLVRLAQEPRRLWRRYLLDDLPGLVTLAPAALATRLQPATRPDVDDLEGLGEELGLRQPVSLAAPR